VGKWDDETSLSPSLPSRHYNTNRAPLSLSFDAAWLEINKGFTKVLAEWIKEKLTGQSDVYFVTELQVAELACKIVIASLSALN